MVFLNHVLLLVNVLNTYIRWQSCTQLIVRKFGNKLE